MATLSNLSNAELSALSRETLETLVDISEEWARRIDQDNGGGEPDLFLDAGMHPWPQLEKARFLMTDSPGAEDYIKLRVYADRKLTVPIQPPVEYRVPAYYEDQEGHNAAKQLLLDSVESAYSAALVSVLTPSDSDKARFGARAKSILLNWARTNERFISGNQTDNKDTALVMSYTGVGMVHAASLVRRLSALPYDEDRDIALWFQKVLYEAGNRIKSRALDANPTNWNDWGILICLAIDQYLGDKARWAEDIDILKRLIDKQILRDGRLPAEHRRGGQSVSYTAFALAPLTAAMAIVLQSGGPDLFDWEPPTGGTVNDALTYLFDRGLMDKEPWPISGTEPYRQAAIGRSAGMFVAMGEHYDNSEWFEWGIRNLDIPKFGTGISWSLPTLCQISGGL